MEITVTARGANGCELPLPIIQPLTRPAPSDTLDGWLAQFFPDGGDETLPGADPDRDGLPNAAEFVFDSSPNDPASGWGDIVITAREVGESRELEIAYPRRSASPVTVYLETSLDLIEWARTEPSQSVEQDPDHPEHENVTATLPPPDGAEDEVYLRFVFEAL